MITLLAKASTALRGGTSDPKRWRSGAAAVEFAMIMPLFALFLMAVFEFGRLFWVEVSLRHAVEQAARYAMAEYTRETFNQANAQDFQTWFTGWGSSIQTVAGNEVYGWDPAAVTWSVTPGPVVTVPGNHDTITVTGSYNFQFGLVFLSGWVNQNLSASSTTPLTGGRTSYIPPP